MFNRKAKKATEEEKAHMGSIKFCMACIKNPSLGLKACPSPIKRHHLLRSNKRRGHMFTIGLCDWHHQGYAPEGHGSKSATIIYGPSFAEGSKPFRAMYGTDDELLEQQNKYLCERHAEF